MLRFKMFVSMERVTNYKLGTLAEPIRKFADSLVEAGE